MIGDTNTINRDCRAYVRLTQPKGLSQDGLFCYIGVYNERIGNES